MEICWTSPRQEGGTNKRQVREHTGNLIAAKKNLSIAKFLEEGKDLLVLSTGLPRSSSATGYWLNMGPILWDRFASSTQHKQTSVKASTHLVGSPNY